MVSPTAKDCFSVVCYVCTDVEGRRDFMTADKRRELRRVREAEAEAVAEAAAVDGLESVSTSATNHSVSPVV